MALVTPNDRLVLESEGRVLRLLSKHRTVRRVEFVNERAAVGLLLEARVRIAALYQG